MTLSPAILEDFMRLALKQAEIAGKKGDVPIGAIIVKENKIIAKGYNLKEKKNNAILHAEIVAINKASKKLKNWRLNDCILFSTVEPCIMCAGAIYHARIKQVFYGCSDPKFGGYGSLTNIQQLKTNHYVETTGQIMAEQSAQLLKDFFKDKRRP